jgi:two-component system sensor histidine kinase KdpD
MVSEAPQAVGERLLALVEPYHGAQRLVRRAWRSAQRLGTDSRPALGPQAGRSPRRRGRALAERPFHQLASLLGAELMVEESDNVAETIARPSPAVRGRRTS